MIPTRVAEVVQSTLEDLLHEANFGTGYQAAVASSATVVGVHGGRNVGAEPLSDAHMFNFYCLGKPLVAHAALDLFESHDLNSFESLRTLFGQQYPAVSLDDLINHRAGLLTPNVAEVLSGLCAPDAAWQLMLGVLERGIKMRMYSDFAAHFFVDLLCLRELGVSARHVATQTALLHHGQEIFFGLTNEQICARRGLIADAVDGRPGLRQAVPLDRVARLSTLGGLGGFVTSTSAALAQLYARVAFARDFRPEPADPILLPFDGTEVGFENGFMSPLRDAGFGPRMPANVFGHTGLGGASGLLIMPSIRIVVVYVVNEFGLGPDLSGILKRRIATSVFGNC
jgi:hypothetical protein